MIGNKFGRLLVIRRFGSNKYGKTILLCKCDCGNSKNILSSSILSGRTKSCGCISKEITIRRNMTHNKSHLKLYDVWSSMKSRATGKGSLRVRFLYSKIRICKAWRRFELFYKWAKTRYKEGLEIDRINNLGDYEPTNCRFITRMEQNKNTRKSKYWFINGIKFNSSSEASIYFNVSQSTVVRWCSGYDSEGIRYKKRDNCYSEEKYANNN